MTDRHLTIDCLSPVQALETVTLQELKVDQVSAQQIVMESETNYKQELWQAFTVFRFINYLLGNPTFKIALNRFDLTVKEMNWWRK